MRRLKKRISRREQVFATALLCPGSADRLVDRFASEKMAQLELEHLRVLLWCHFLEDLVDDDFDALSILGKGERAILDEAIQILGGTAGWDYSPDN